MDDDTRQLLMGLGIDPDALMAPSAEDGVAGAVAGAAAEMVPTGPLGVLPQWARGVAQQVYQSPDFTGEIPDGGYVYMDTGHGKREGTPSNKFQAELDPAAIPTDNYSADNTSTYAAANNLPYTWSQDEVRDAMEKMRQAGMQVNTFEDLTAAWSGLVSRAAISYTATEGKKKLTPWDVLDLYKQEASDSGLLDKLNGDRTTVSRNVTDIDEGQAWVSLQGTLSSMLGRDPSDQETRDFTYRMGQLAARNPSISKTVTKYKDGEATGSSTHTTPGFTSADLAHEAYDNAQSDPGYAEFQSASTYFNALQSALGPIGG